MNLYNKYRPPILDEVVGNEAALETIEKLLKKTNHPHVYLFSGPPGTGKTTLARIVSKMVGAEEMDVREVNTSSARGIDTAREIIQKIQMKPMFGKAIAYILDECHKFTNDMQNALLKPLEDTPEHVYFFLCTTNPEKLIKAIKSRCTQIVLTTLNEDEMSIVLRRAAKGEGVKLDKDILEALIDASEGSPRKGLVLLESILNIDDKDRQLKFLSTATIDEDDADVIELCRALLNEKMQWKNIAEILRKMRDAGKLDDSESVRYAVLNYMGAVIMSGKLIPRAVGCLEYFAEPTYNSGKNGIVLACLQSIS